MIQELERLLSEPYVLLDGAMGTMLMRVGLESGAAPEAWNLRHPERIQAVHRSYIEAGSQIILTNSFGGTRFRLKLHDLQDQVVELNRAAAINARTAADAADRPIIVGGSMGPTGELLSPLGTMTYESTREAFAEQARGLSEGGVDLLWVETMSDLQEVRAAVEGARSVSSLPIVATMTFDTNGSTMMGVDPVQALRALKQLDLFALGGNCGNGPQEIESVIRTMRAEDADSILVAKSNAGLPKWIDDALIYDGTPEVMANYAVRVRSLGAQLIGACCGSTPDHIRAMAAALKQDDFAPVSIGQQHDEGLPTAGDGSVQKPAPRARRHRRRRTRR